jgi:hypothetical protein
MIYLLGMAPRVVVGTSLVMILAVSAATTMIHALTTHAVDIVLAALLLVGGVLGAQYGARLTTRLKPDLLRFSLARHHPACRAAHGAWPHLPARRAVLDRISVRLRLLLVALLAPLLMGQAGPRLVPDISARAIEIRYSFTGAQLLLFGAILYPGGRTPTRALDVVVVLKGPVQPMIVREKQKIAGIWMNADSHRFASAPSYYAVASNRPLQQIVGERTAAVYELGLQNLQLSPGGGAQPDKAAGSRPACSSSGRGRGSTRRRQRRGDQRRSPVPRPHNHPEPGPGRHLRD